MRLDSQSTRRIIFQPLGYVEEEHTMTVTAAATGAKVKGTIMTQVVKYLRSRREEGRAAVPDRLGHYLQARILATSWYPEEDYIDLMRGVVAILPPGPNPGISGFEHASRDTADAYFEGPYSVLVRQGQPGATLKNLESLWRLRHDTGHMKIVVEGNKALVELRGYPIVSWEMCDLIKGSIWGILSYAGAERIEVQHRTCRSKGDPECDWEATWG